MKGKYSERELLLLSNFVYIPASMSYGTIKEITDRYKDENGVFTLESTAAAAAGGGMSPEDVKTVLEQMDAQIERDPAFGELSVARTLDEHDVRALCYTNERDEFPVIAFRGTGGTQEAWRDNFEGAFIEDTRLQKVADDFVKNECAIYRNIVVTGHSKGGNLAQYVTVKENGRVGECVSFDGQGFGDDFIRENPDGIRIASPRIKSVSAYNDFVNILLYSIAGTCVYVANDSSAAAAHSPVTLLTANTFDVDGNIKSIRKQGALASQLDGFSDKICKALGRLGDNDKKAFGMMAGSAVSLALTTPKEEFEEGCAYPLIGMLGTNLMLKMASEAEELKEDINRVSGSVYLDAAKTRTALDAIREQSAVVGVLAAKVDGVRQTLAYTISAKKCAEYALERVCENLERIRKDMERFADISGDLVGMYEKTEKETVALMGYKIP